MKFVCTLNPQIKGDLKECLMNTIPLPNSLWFPEIEKPLSPDFFKNIDKMDFHSIALEVLNNILGDDIPKSELEKIIKESLNFDMPLIEINNNISILELFHGPTFTFKDVGSRFMARILKYFYPEGTKEFDIIVSTSGDTGSAVADAFQDLDNVKVHILYPKGLISDVQEKQLTTYGKNIFAYQVDGNFDECQDLVKQSLRDDELTKKLLFFPANSINIARLIPQSLYYFWAYAQLKKSNPSKCNSLNICVPSGNLGNLSGGIIAYKLGLPINHFIGATNINDTFKKYLLNGSEGIKDIERAKPTLSSAMDISIPNNLKRLIFAFKDSEIEKTISSYSVTDDETLAGITEFKNKYNYSLDPHTSVGYIGIKKYLDQTSKTDENFIIISTAHPAKFYKTMDMVNVSYSMPEKISTLLKMKGNKKEISTNYQVWKNILINSSKKNITLIGMPFSGKTTIGKKLAEKLNYNFIDIDHHIENKYQMKLPDVVNKYGNDEFKIIEENAMLEMSGNKNIFSTGGSVIYSEKGMKHLQEISNIVFLNVELEVLKSRININDLKERGIVFKEGQSFDKLFEERVPLYKKFCTETINCYSLDVMEIINLI